MFGFLKKRAEAKTRDMFAAVALQALIAKLPVIDQTGEFGVRVEDKVGYNRDICASAFEFADTMMEARKVYPEDVERAKVAPKTLPPVPEKLPVVLNRPWKERHG